MTSAFERNWLNKDNRDEICRNDVMVDNQFSSRKMYPNTARHHITLFYNAKINYSGVSDILVCLRLTNLMNVRNTTRKIWIWQQLLISPHHIEFQQLIGYNGLCVGNTINNIKSKHYYKLGEKINVAFMLKPSTGFSPKNFEDLVNEN